MMYRVPVCIPLTGICYPNNKTVQSMDQISPKLPNPSDFLHVKSTNVMMDDIGEKPCSLGLDMMFSSLFPHLFVSNPASKSPTEGRLFTSPFTEFFIAANFQRMEIKKKKSPEKLDTTERFFCCFD